MDKNDLQLFRSECLAAHNFYRALHATTPLTWSSRLAEGAQNWAEQLAATDSLTYSHERGVGENIACLWGSELTGNKVVQVWYEDERHFDYTDPRVTPQTRPFCQVVWEGSRELGAGKATTKHGKQVVVARYNPALNRNDAGKNIKAPRLDQADGSPLTEFLIHRETLGLRKFQEECLFSHNQYRVNHGAPFLRWSPPLAWAAQQWAEELVRMGELRHNDDEMVGENLAGMVGDELTGMEAACMWYEEVADYDFQNPSYSEDTSNFTQVVWVGSELFGVGRATLGDLCVVVSFYEPPGNMEGLFSRNVLMEGTKVKALRTREAKIYIPPSPGLDSFRLESLVAHNYYRARHGAPPLVTSHALSEEAQYWAERLLVTGTTEDLHNSRIGINVATIDGSFISGVKVTEVWYNEVFDYDFDSPGFSPSTRSFTQLVWLSSRKFGVGKATNLQGQSVVVARYEPVGNIDGLFVPSVKRRGHDRNSCEPMIFETDVRYRFKVTGRRSFRMSWESEGTQILQNVEKNHSNPRRTEKAQPAYFSPTDTFTRLVWIESPVFPRKEIQARADSEGEDEDKESGVEEGEEEEQQDPNFIVVHAIPEVEVETHFEQVIVYCESVLIADSPDVRRPLSLDSEGTEPEMHEGHVLSKVAFFEKFEKPELDRADVTKKRISVEHQAEVDRDQIVHEESEAGREIEPEPECQLEYDDVFPEHDEQEEDFPSEDEDDEDEDDVSLETVSEADEYLLDEIDEDTMDDHVKSCTLKGHAEGDPVRDKSPEFEKEVTDMECETSPDHFVAKSANRHEVIQDYMDYISKDMNFIPMDQGDKGSKFDPDNFQFIETDEERELFTFDFDNKAKPVSQKRPTSEEEIQGETRNRLEHEIDFDKMFENLEKPNELNVADNAQKECDIQESEGIQDEDDDQEKSELESSGDELESIIVLEINREKNLSRFMNRLSKKVGLIPIEETKPVFENGQTPDFTESEEERMLFSTFEPPPRMELKHGGPPCVEEIQAVVRQRNVESEISFAEMFERLDREKIPEKVEVVEEKERSEETALEEELSTDEELGEERPNTEDLPLEEYRVKEVVEESIVEQEERKKVVRFNEEIFIQETQEVHEVDLESDLEFESSDKFEHCVEESDECEEDYGQEYEDEGEAKMSQVHPESVGQPVFFAYEGIAAETVCDAEGQEQQEEQAESFEEESVNVTESPLRNAGYPIFVSSECSESENVCDTCIVDDDEPSQSVATVFEQYQASARDVIHENDCGVPFHLAADIKSSSENRELEEEATEIDSCDSYKDLVPTASSSLIIESSTCHVAAEVNLIQSCEDHVKEEFETDVASEEEDEELEPVVVHHISETSESSICITTEITYRDTMENVTEHIPSVETEMPQEEVESSEEVKTEEIIVNGNSTVLHISHEVSDLKIDDAILEEEKQVEEIHFAQASRTKDEVEGEVISAREALCEKLPSLICIADQEKDEIVSEEYENEELFPEVEHAGKVEEEVVSTSEQKEESQYSLFIGGQESQDSEYEVEEDQEIANLENLEEIEDEVFESTQQTEEEQPTCFIIAGDEMEERVSLEEVRDEDEVLDMEVAQTLEEEEEVAVLHEQNYERTTSPICIAADESDNCISEEIENEEVVSFSDVALAVDEEEVVVTHKEKVVQESEPILVPEEKVAQVFDEDVEIKEENISETSQVEEVECEKDETVQYVQVVESADTVATETLEELEEETKREKTTAIKEVQKNFEEKVLETTEGPENKFDSFLESVDAVGGSDLSQVHVACEQLEYISEEELEEKEELYLEMVTSFEAREEKEECNIQNVYVQQTPSSTIYIADQEAEEGAEDVSQEEMEDISYDSEAIREMEDELTETLVVKESFSATVYVAPEEQEEQVSGEIGKECETENFSCPVYVTTEQDEYVEDLDDALFDFSQEEHLTTMHKITEYRASPFLPEESKHEGNEDQEEKILIKSDQTEDIANDEEDDIMDQRSKLSSSPVHISKESEEIYVTMETVQVDTELQQLAYKLDEEFLDVQEKPLACSTPILTTDESQDNFQVKEEILTQEDMAEELDENRITVTEITREHSISPSIHLSAELLEHYDEFSTTEEDMRSEAEFGEEFEDIANIIAQERSLDISQSISFQESSEASNDEGFQQIEAENEATKAVADEFEDFADICSPESAIEWPVIIPGELEERKEQLEEQKEEVKEEQVSDYEENVVITEQSSYEAFSSVEVHRPHHPGRLQTLETVNLDEEEDFLEESPLWPPPTITATEFVADEEEEGSDEEYIPHFEYPRTYVVEDKEVVVDTTVLEKQSPIEITQKKEMKDKREIPNDHVEKDQQESAEAKELDENVDQEYEEPSELSRVSETSTIVVATEPFNGDAISHREQTTVITSSRTVQITYKEEPVIENIEEREEKEQLERQRQASEEKLLQEEIEDRMTNSDMPEKVITREIISEEMKTESTVSTIVSRVIVEKEDDKDRIYWETTASEQLLEDESKLEEKPFDGHAFQEEVEVMKVDEALTESAFRAERPSETYITEAASVEPDEYYDDKTATVPSVPVFVPDDSTNVHEGDLEKEKESDHLYQEELEIERVINYDSDDSTQERQQEEMHQYEVYQEDIEIHKVQAGEPEADIAGKDENDDVKAGVFEEEIEIERVLEKEEEEKMHYGDQSESIDGSDIYQEEVIIQRVLEDEKDMQEENPEDEQDQYFVEEIEIQRMENDTPEEDQIETLIEDVTDDPDKYEEEVDVIAVEECLEVEQEHFEEEVDEVEMLQALPLDDDETTMDTDERVNDNSVDKEETGEEPEGYEGEEEGMQKGLEGVVSEGEMHLYDDNNNNNNNEPMPIYYVDFSPSGSFERDTGSAEEGDYPEVYHQGEPLEEDMEEFILVKYQDRYESSGEEELIDHREMYVIPEEESDDAHHSHPEPTHEENTEDDVVYYDQGFENPALEDICEEEEDEKEVRGSVDYVDVEERRQLEEYERLESFVILEEKLSQVESDESMEDISSGTDGKHCSSEETINEEDDFGETLTTSTLKEDMQSKEASCGEECDTDPKGDAADVERVECSADPQDVERVETCVTEVTTTDLEDGSSICKTVTYKESSTVSNLEMQTCEEKKTSQAEEESKVGDGARVCFSTKVDTEMVVTTTTHTTQSGVDEKSFEEKSDDENENVFQKDEVTEVTQQAIVKSQICRGARSKESYQSETHSLEHSGVLSESKAVKSYRGLVRPLDSESEGHSSEVSSITSSTDDSTSPSSEGQLSDEDLSGLDDFQTDCLKQHNIYRYQHRATRLVWSANLAKDAESWAEHLATTSSLEHSPQKECGENLACVGGYDLRGDKVAEMWYDEVKDYNFDTLAFNAKCGHFTQLVWRGTTEFAVAKKVSQDGTQYVVARYYPPGNVLGEFRENIKRAKGQRSSVRKRRRSSARRRSSQSSDVEDILSQQEKFKSECVISHNYYRSLHGANQLQWSPMLAVEAQKWADKLAKSGSFMHSGVKERGESLAFAFGLELSGRDAVDTWYEELVDYDFEYPGFTSHTGNITQLIWAGTQEFGMGKTVGEDGSCVVVGRYYPPGNLVGQFQENVKPKGAGYV